MMPRRSGSIGHEAFDQRIGLALRQLGVDDAPSRLARLRGLVDAVAAQPTGDHLWLLYVSLSGAFPESDEVIALRRAIELAVDSDARVEATLALVHDVAIERGSWDRPMRLIQQGTLVEVDFCAKHEHNSGIQRVVRETVMRWEASHEIDLVAWVVHGSALRGLYDHERDRVLKWGSSDRERGEIASPHTADLVVPVGGRIIVTEVPSVASCRWLAAIAEHTSTEVHLIGYDTIPLGSADHLPALESERFARYLELVKYATSVVTISEAAGEEFHGFVDAVRVQEVSGPRVEAVVLPGEFPGTSHRDNPVRQSGLVLCVGSHEGRKNQRALVFAAERLTREGIPISLHLVGRGSASFIGAFDADVAAARSRGVDVRVRRDVGDAELAELYSTARVVAFPSLQEGFGLPIVEALAHGTPVLTSSYGSMAEVASAGGCVVVDPRDDEAIVAALRSVLTDEQTYERLRAEARARPHRSWNDYAEQTWHAFGGTQ